MLLLYFQALSVNNSLPKPTLFPLIIGRSSLSSIIISAKPNSNFCYFRLFTELSAFHF